MAEFNEIKTPDMHEPWDGKGLPPGVGPTLLGLIGVLLVVAVPYLVTPLIPEESELHEKVGDMRVWLEGDDLPFSKHFRTSRPKAHGDEGPSLAAAPGPGEVSAAPGAGGTVDDPGLPAEPVIAVEPAPAEPAPTKPGTPAPTTPEPPQNPLARIHIPASSWDGLSTFIEDPKGALGHFYGQLAKVALKEPGAMARVSHFGDSAIAADGMPSSTRRLLQRTFGDGGHGFSLVAATNNWYRRKDIEWTSKGWTGEAFISDDAKDARYGFGGTAATGSVGAKATWKTVEVDPKQGEHTVGTRASRFAVHYLAHKSGGRFAISVDGAEKQVVDTASETLEDKVVEVEVEDGPHTFELKVVGGRVKVYGAVIERRGGVVYDGLGTIGARDTRWENFDPAHAQGLFAMRGTDLAVFMYGGNQLEDKLSMAAYKDKLTGVVRLWRAGLGTRSCLIMSPIDHGERHRGRVRTVPRQVDIMKVQKEVALAEGCAWFSLYDAMGGNGSIGEWYEQKLAEGDLAHPTSRGAVILGQLFFKALMKGFAEHLERAVGAPK